VISPVKWINVCAGLLLEQIPGLTWEDEKFECHGDVRKYYLADGWTYGEVTSYLRALINEATKDLNTMRPYPIG